MIERSLLGRSQAFIDKISSGLLKHGAGLLVSRATVQNRLDRLLESGAVLSFTLRVRQDYDANTIRAIMMIEVTGRSMTAVIKRLRGLPELHSLHTTNGGWDLVAEIRASGLSDFDRVLGKVRMIDGILNTETSLILSSI